MISIKSVRKNIKTDQGLEKGDLDLEQEVESNNILFNLLKLKL